MKNSKKTCGILGTSMGSMLIIVALLTMVGMGSNDTYAAGACVCGAGQVQRGPDCFDEHSNKWVGTCETSSSPSGSSPSSSKPSSSKPSSSQPSSSTASTTCPAGKYYRGNGMCYTCPAGSYCPGGSLGATSCPAGTTSPAGSSSSSACKSTSSTTTCAAGAYYSGQGSCATCLAGYYCPGGTFSSGDSSRAGITACPAGTTSTAGSSSSSACKSTSGTPTATCTAGTYYDGSYGCLPCTEGFYCPGGTFSHSTADINGSGKKSCPDNTTCTATGFTCNSGYVKNSAETACVASGGGNTGGSGSGSGGNGGGNTGGNGGNTGGNNGGNTGGNNGGNGGNGNNSGSSNVNKNPGTLTKTPLVIALIGMISVGLGTFTYFKGKKEQNNEI